jgi:hypothetical protein
VLPTLAIVCFALGVIMYVPTLSKATLNWRRGVAMYESFPWNGPEKHEDTAGASQPDRPLTMEEMMKKARENAAQE